MDESYSTEGEKNTELGVGGVGLIWLHGRGVLWHTKAWHTWYFMDAPTVL